MKRPDFEALRGRTIVRVEDGGKSGILLFLDDGLGLLVTGAGSLGDLGRRFPSRQPSVVTEKRQALRGAS